MFGQAGVGELVGAADHAVRCARSMQIPLPWSNNVNKIRLSLAHSLLATLLAGTIVFAASPAGATPELAADSQAAVPKPGSENFVQRLIGALRSEGLEVSVGYPRLWTEADCAYSYPVYHNCFGNNPAAPYVVPVVKPWPEEYVDPAMENGLGKTLPGYSATYRLDPREAIIVFGRMPPPARYIGLQTWIWSTGWLSDGSPWDEVARNEFAAAAGPLIQYLFATVPPANFASEPPVYGDRVQSISSLHNNINNVVMEKQSGLPWDQMRYFVVTPDQHADAVVRKALVNLGVDEDGIFTEGIPPNFEGAPVGPLGLGKDAVDFFTNFRYAMPENESLADAWRKSLPLTVLRVRRVTGTPQPFDNRRADKRIAVDEISDTSLGSGLSSLIDAVIARAKSQGLALEKAPEEMRDLQSDLGNFGPHCRKIGMNCLGDNQDATYFLFTPRPLDTGRIYAAVGTLATETGNGTYVGLSVNDASLLKGVQNIPDSKLKGSASSYGSAVTNAGKFFVHFFTRDCDAIADLTDGACTTITTDMVPLANDDKAPGDPKLHGMFSAAVRAYVAPGSERSANPKLQLRPIALTFTKD
jgi:hypothetical protein